VVNGQRYAPDKKPGIRCTGVWMGRGAGLNRREKSRPYVYNSALKVL